MIAMPKKPASTWTTLISIGASGIFRLIVIAQQIYYRFYHKQTKDQRFAQLGLAVHILANAANGIVEGRLDI